MAENDNTTTLLVAAAVVVVAVMWSRRSSAATPAPRPYGAGGGAASSPDYGATVRDVGQGIGALFSGLSDLVGGLSSSDEAAYVMPSNGSPASMYSAQAFDFCSRAGYVDASGNPTTECLATYG